MSSDVTTQRTSRVRIPADVDRPDPLVFGLSARPLAILSATALVLYLAFSATRHVVPLPVVAGFAAPVAVVAVTLAVGRRAGVSADRLALAGLRWRTSTRRLVPTDAPIRPAPGWAGPSSPLPAPLRLPASAIDDAGVIDLGRDGAALVCRASSLTFSLRTADEQHALVGAFARWLNALTEPVQIVVRTQPVDLSDEIRALRERAGGLPHPALEQAAREHATFLEHLTGGGHVLRRDLLVVLRDPNSDDAATRLLRVADDAIGGLAAAGVTLTPLGTDDAFAALAHTVAPGHQYGGASHPATVVTGRSPS